MNKDNIYSEKLDEVPVFSFDEKVVSVFPDMINRSVPGYGTMVSMIGVLAAQYAKDGTSIYDLGCSLGAVSFAVSENLPENFNGRIIAVDYSPAMIEKLESILDSDYKGVKIVPVQSSVESAEIANASVIIMNLTLQFVRPDLRLSVIRKIYDGLCDGGVLILSEKITFGPDNNDMNELLFSYKRAQGYSDIEIEQKKQALDNFLIPECIEVHIDRLKQAGFSTAFQWYQCLNFISIIAYKHGAE